MQYVFLVGGFGTRLGSLTKSTPKPLLEISGSPFLLHLIKWAKCAHAHHILLLSGYKGDQIDRFAVQYSTPDVKIDVVHETTPLGTGGSVLNAIHFLEDDFILCNGDSWLAFDPLALVQQNKNTLGVMALRKLNDTSQSGVVTTDEENVVTNFMERGDGTAGLINAGIYYLKKSIFSLKTIQTKSFSIEKDFFPVITNQHVLSGYAFDGYFIDIGTPTNFKTADDEFMNEIRKFVQNPNSETIFSGMIS